MQKYDLNVIFESFRFHNGNAIEKDLEIFSVIRLVYPELAKWIIRPLPKELKKVDRLELETLKEITQEAWEHVLKANQRVLLEEPDDVELNLTIDWSK